jgi:hypothetical protein
MISKKLKYSDSRHNVFGATLARFARRRNSRVKTRLGALRRVPLLHRFARRSEIMASDPDPVSLAIFAIDHVGPAAVRACASGVQVCVAAPDEATAAICRAALAETARRRGTDRLVQIVVG